MKLSKEKKLRKWAWLFDVSYDDAAIWVMKKIRAAMRRRKAGRRAA